MLFSTGRVPSTTLSALTLALLARHAPAWQGAPQAPEPDPASAAPPDEAADAAPETGDPYPDAETIVITPSADAVDIFSVPYAGAVIGRRELTERAYRTTPQVFRYTPGVMVQETAYGQGSPFIRGFTGYRNLMMIDGVRLNNSVFRSGPNQYWNTVDPFSVDRYELIKGPSSVLMGSDAIGGTVNVFTRSADNRGPGTHFGGALSYRFASAEQSHMARAEGQVTNGDRWGLLVGLTGKTFGDVQGGSDIGTQPNTGYDEWDGDVKFEFRPDVDSTLTFLHQRVHQEDVPRTHKTIFAKSFEGTDVGTELQRELDQDRTLTYLQYRQEGLGGLFDLFSAGVSWHDQSEERRRERTGDRMDVQGFDVGTLGLFTRFATEETSAGTFSFGVDAYRDHVDSYLRNLTSPNPADEIQGPVADDSTYDLIGVYVQDELAVTERLDVTLGARFQYAHADANSVRDPVTDTQTSLDEDWSAVVGSARFVYALVEEQVNLFGGISQGFRAPNLSDLTRFDTARSNEFEIPAPGLDPEYTTQYELGVRTQTARSTVQLASFYTDIRDTIVRTPTGDVNGDGDFEVTKSNVGDGYVWGIEFAGSYGIGAGWSVFGNTTYMDGEVDTFPTSDPVVVSEPIDRLMPWTTMGGLRWDRRDSRLWAETTGIYAADADELSTRDANDTERIPPGGTPSYFVWDVRGGYHVNDHTELTLALENILDEDYRVHGSGINRPGINLIFGLHLHF